MVEENKELRRIYNSSLSNLIGQREPRENIVNKDVEANQEVALIGASIEEYLETLSMFDCPC